MCFKLTQGRRTCGCDWQGIGRKCPMRCHCQCLAWNSTNRKELNQVKHPANHDSYTRVTAHTEIHWKQMWGRTLPRTWLFCKMSFLQLHSTKKQSTQLNYTPGACNFGLSRSNQKEVHGLGRGGLKGSMHRQVTIDSQCLQSMCRGGGGGVPGEWGEFRGCHHVTEWNIFSIQCY